MARSSPGEDRPFECTMEPDVRTLEFADNTFAVALWVRLRHKRERDWANGHGN